MNARLFIFRLLLIFLGLCGLGSAQALELKPNSVEILVGEIAKVAVTKSSGSISVKSSNTSVATVSYASGIASIKGVKAGSATITVRDRESSKRVEVKVISAPSSVLTISPAVVAVNVGGSTTVTVTNASGTVSVQSSDNSVATVSYANNLATVKGIKAGSATVTIRDSKTSKTVAVTVLNTTAIGEYTLLAWNDLGMHCMDGLDFSVFAILPPYNTLHAQLKDKNGKLVSSNVLLTYEAVADSSGSINTSSANKTNFWSWVGELVGLNPAPDVGVNLDGLASGNPMPGNKTPSLKPAPMTYNTAFDWFEAEGIPVTPFDDKGNKNFYPTVKVVAKDALSGKVLASATTVLPVSDEMTCKGCHASTDANNNAAQTAAKPVAGWVFDADPDKDWKRNILRLHDEKQAANTLFKDALSTLSAKGYKASGLLTTADAGQPVLCVACHASNAYFDKENKTTVMGGMAGIAPFTQSLHLKHADVKDPATQLTLDSLDNRSACYQCHPGSVTQCLRGAMSTASDASGDPSISCQSCHGNMKAVGSPTRQGWFNEPTCESCHNSAAPGKRAISGIDASGKAIVPTDHTFATNANTPVPGLNLYRFSKGHGGLQCEACHGATHAEYPSTHADENLQSIAVQGHAGTVAECKACHTTVPNTVNGGPHGMHTTGDAWVKQHEDANKNGTATTPSCSYCHGTTSAGTPLSAVKVAKTIDADEFGIKNWPAGYQVSCFSCHNGPNP
ncbi:Ig-like domain-containing protein [Methylomonas sp. MK1]|uniref:Ig-like domain-containing protein n=1 Tax=Methylomonas sp. MK1 TaxID=1131552 RepID=UPI0003762D8F|nr:Ig-like domain-containing protein [Methylomonas sp. MK1]